MRLRLKKIINWVLFLFLLYIIFELTRKILGGSLGFEELVIALLTANIGYVISLHSKISELDSKFAGHIGWHKGKDEVKN